MSKSRRSVQIGTVFSALRKFWRAKAKPSPPWGFRGRSLLFELLEDRVVLALDVTYSAGALSIFSDIDADISIFVALGDVKVNGADPTGGPVAAHGVSSVNITDSHFGNMIDLSGVTASDFTSLASIFVHGAGGDDLLLGSEFADILLGGGGDDTLSGGLGSDTYVFDSSSAGTDVVVELAGEGSDWLDFSLAPGPLFLSLDDAQVQDWANGSLILDDPTAIENIMGTSFDDRIGGNSAGNLIIGGDGNDTVVGLAGDDLLAGNDGADMLAGGDGFDILIAGAGADFATGDSGDDVIVAADFDSPNVPTETLIDVRALADVLLFAWTENAPASDRMANLTGASGAPNPLPLAYQFAAGQSLFDDGIADILAATIGTDVVFLESRQDLPAYFTSNRPLFGEIDPAFPEMETQYENACAPSRNPCLLSA